MFSPDGERLATTALVQRRPERSDEELVCLWDARRAIRLLPPLDSGFPDVQFSSDGRLLLAVDNGGKATVWDSITGKIIGGPFLNTDPDNEGKRARFSPDGQLVLIGEIGRAHV